MRVASPATPVLPPRNGFWFTDQVTGLALPSFGTRTTEPHPTTQEKRESPPSNRLPLSGPWPRSTSCRGPPPRGTERIFRALFQYTRCESTTTTVASRSAPL